MQMSITPVEIWFVSIAAIVVASVIRPRRRGLAISLLALSLGGVTVGWLLYRRSGSTVTLRFTNGGRTTRVSRATLTSNLIGQTVAVVVQPDGTASWLESASATR
jgi:hypothetical protein